MRFGLSSLIILAFLPSLHGENALDICSRNYLNISPIKCQFTHSESKTAKARKADCSTNEVEVFITVSTASIIDLEAVGLKDALQFGNRFLGRINSDNIDALSRIPGVERVSIDRELMLKNDRSRAFSHVDAIHNGQEDLPQQYTGNGVLVGIYDQGIDFGHINFIDTDTDELRIKAVYNYSVEEANDGKTVTTQNCYYGPNEILALGTDRDYETHGTHTLGILAGSYADSKGDYHGMAPKSEMLVGCGPITYSYVLRAVKNMIEDANDLGKPIAINLSFGDNIGPHDGSDDFPAALNELAQDYPIFMAAGNEGNLNISLNKTFTEDDKEIKTVVVPRRTIYQVLGSSYEACSEIQVWSEDATPFTLQIGLYDKLEDEMLVSLPIAADGQVSYIANGDFAPYATYTNDDFDYYYDNSVIGVGNMLDNVNQRYCSDIWMLLNKRTNHIDRNIVPVIIVTGEPGKRVDIFCDGDYNELSNSKMEDWDCGNADNSISNIACGKNTISVGSYCSRLIFDPSIEGEVSDFSSYGTLHDGRTLPDILAPGDCIASSMSRYYVNSDYFDDSVTGTPIVFLTNGEDDMFCWTLQRGTSMAAPAMTGIAALWLEANPDLTPAEIRQIACETATPTENMTVQCGAGKVDALAGLKRVLEMHSSIANVNLDNKNPFLITSLGNNRYEVFNADATDFTVKLTNMSGITVDCKSSSDSSLIINAANYVPGIYLITLNNGSHSFSQKIRIK